MNQIFFLQGLARSGKSTVAKRWVNFEVDIKDGELIERNQGKKSEEPPRVIVCADDIRLTFGHRFNWMVEDYIHAIKNTMIKTLRQKHSLVIDGTHTTKGSIIAVLNIDINADYYRIDTSVETCCQRAIATNQSDLIPVIQRMGQQLATLPPIEDIRKEVIAYKTINDTTKTIV